MNDIKDIRPPVDDPLNGWWILFGTLAFLIIAAIVVLLRRGKRQEKPALVAVLPSSWEIALKKLEILFLKNYPEQGMYKDFYMELSNIVRHYLEDRFAIKAPEMTTEEFLVFVQNSPKLNEQQKKFLRGFLDGCDLVKFAKHMPTIDEAMFNFKLAKGLVEETRE